MKAIRCAAPGVLEPIERDMPQRRDGEVLLRMRRMGVCGTDMHIFAGNQPFFEYPRVIGHELSAEVIETGPGSRLKAGDLVYINPYLACGSCHACRIGKPNCCQVLRVLGVHTDGGLAEYLALPEANAIRADGLTVDQAAMIEFLAVGAHAVARSGVEPGQSVLVAGAGPIGVGVALFARLRGARVTVADMRPERLAFCDRELGVGTITVTPDITAELKDRTGGDFFETVFDATGNPRSIETQFGHVASGGTYVIVSVVQDRIGFADPEFHRRELTLRASRNALASDFDRVVGAMRDGLVPTGALNTHRVAFDDFPAAMPRLIDPSSGVIKALVEIA